MGLYDSFFPTHIKYEKSSDVNFLWLESIEDLDNFAGARVTYSVYLNEKRMVATVDVTEETMAQPSFKDTFPKLINSRIEAELDD